MLENRISLTCDLIRGPHNGSYLLEGPPGLARDSFAYRFAGFRLS